MKDIFQVLCVLLILPVMVQAQNTYTLTGRVVDKGSGDALPGANIIFEGTFYGNASNTDGTFEVADVPAGTYRVRISYVGYSSRTLSVTLDHNVDLGTIALKEYEFSKEVIVSAKRARFRQTPVAFSSVGKRQIRETGVANQDLSMAVAGIPNVYATSGSGGIGDSRLSIRGFDDNYVGILINGVPVNDMETGHMYWSDWSGLASIATDIQVTMGLGANPLSTQAVGGTVNITTSSLQAQQGGQVVFGLGDNGRHEVGLQYSTGLTDAGNGGKYGFTVFANRIVSDSYFNYSHYQGFTWFFTLGYTKGKNTINLTTFGTPQTHDQRFTSLTPDEWARYGYDYNPNVGFYGSGDNMHFVNEGVNYYFKPVFSIDDTYRINANQMITGTLYYSFGKGYGSGSSGRYAPADPVTGLLDYNQVFAYNTNHPDSAFSYGGTFIRGNASQSILSDSHNDHQWGGVIINYRNRLTRKLTMNLSFDGRSYVGSHYQTVRNLLGGDFYVEHYNANYGRIAAFKDDKIGYYDLGYVNKYGGNLQVEYTTSKYSAFIDGSLSNTGYARKDYFIKGNPKTGFYNFAGWVVKGGVNVNLTGWLNVFTNAGYNDRAPYFNGVFRYTNDPIPGRHNEKIGSIELGVGLRPNARSSVTIDLYHTRWADQTLNFTSRTIAGSGESYLYNVNDLNEIHEGIEMRGNVWFTDQLSMQGGVAVSNNYYENNPTAFGFNNENQPSGQGILYLKGLKVSNAPQTTGSLGFTYRTRVKGNGSFFITPRARYAADYYAGFYPEDRLSPGDQNRQAYKIKPYAILDLISGYTFTFRHNFSGFKSAEILLSITNLMDARFISSATDYDGTWHNLDVFFGRPRTVNANITFYF